MCWYNYTLMNLVETALHCTIVHKYNQAYTYVHTCKKIWKNGRSNQTSIKQKWSSGYTYKNENSFQSSQNRNPCIVTLACSVLKRTLNKNNRGLDSKSELLTTYSLWKKYQLYLSTYLLLNLLNKLSPWIWFIAKCSYNKGVKCKSPLLYASSCIVQCRILINNSLGSISTYATHISK